MPLILQYLILAIVVVYAAIKVSDSVDLLDKKTNISGALIGGLLLAATTSLPEVITSMTTIRLNEPNLAVGNIFGSNIFNILIIALADLYFFKRYFLNKVSNHNIKSLLYVVALYAVIGISILLPQGVSIAIIGLNFSLVAIISVVLYFLTIKSLAQGDGEEMHEQTLNEKVVDKSIKRIIFWFVAWAIVLVGTSILLTIVTDKMQDAYNLSASLAGALFLGIATSLPEATAVFYLVRIRSYDLALANIIGSNIFNLAILALVDFVYVDDDVFLSIKSNAFTLWLLGLVNCLILLYTLYRKKSINKVTYFIPSILIVGAYLTYLIISI